MEKTTDLYLEARYQTGFYENDEKLAILYGYFHGLKLAESFGDQIIKIQLYDLAKSTWASLVHGSISTDRFRTAVFDKLKEYEITNPDLDFSILESCDRSVAGHYARAFGIAFDVAYQTSKNFGHDLEFYLHWLKVRQNEILTLLAPLTTNSEFPRPRRAR